MSRTRTERRSLIDRIRLSEFFALICTGFMLLTLFLLTSTREVMHPTQPLNAGFSGRVIPSSSPDSLDDEPVFDESLAPRIPSRSIESIR